MPSERPAKQLFATATATTTSPVFSPGKNGNFDLQFKKTNTGLGNVAIETNDVDEDTFKAAPTANWVPHDLADSAKTSSGKLTVPATDPWSDKITLRGMSARRIRVVFTKSSGTVAFYGWMSGN